MTCWWWRGTGPAAALKQELESRHGIAVEVCPADLSAEATSSAWPPGWDATAPRRCW
jgi:hypothetical protein